MRGANDPPGTGFADHGYLLQGTRFTGFDLPPTAVVPSGIPFAGPITVPVSFPDIRGINNTNDIVGGFSKTCTPANPFRPPDPNCFEADYGFILRANSTFQPLEACSSATLRVGSGCDPGTTDGWGINDGLTAVGHYQDSAGFGPEGDNTHHGLIYSGTVYTPLFCNGDRTLNTDANAINNQGTIVGACEGDAFVLFPPYRLQDWRTFSVIGSCPIAGMTIQSTVA